jgi:hypothetical protein
MARRLGGLQSRSGGGGEEKILLPLPGIESGRPNRSLVTKLTELPQFTYGEEFFSRKLVKSDYSFI